MMRKDDSPSASSDTQAKQAELDARQTLIDQLHDAQRDNSRAQTRAR